jgi:hypothetical protein
MNKKFSLRLFTNKTDLTPFATSPICDVDGVDYNSFHRDGADWGMIDWLQKHPGGKVEIVIE